MPEVQEVFRMATQKVRPDPGAMERQFRGQRRRTTRRKAGVYGLVAALVVGATVVAVSALPEGGSDTPGTKPVGHTPQVVATEFLAAYGAFDTGEVIGWLSRDADISGLAWGARGEGAVDQLRLVMGLQEAQGFKLILDRCEERESEPSVDRDGDGEPSRVTNLRCYYDFHSLRSDEIGRGPFSGSYFDLIVRTEPGRDGGVLHVSGYLEIEEFSPRMWEPFTDWVYKAYPEDAAVMYELPHSLERLSEESIRLWERRVREYVSVAPTVASDYVLDLDKGTKTPLPENIVGADNEATHYAASPDGSMLAYVAPGDGGTSQIFVADLDGSGVREVTHEPVGADWPAWSPDGTTIAYQGGAVGLSSVPGDLFILDVASAESTLIADGVAAPDSGLQFTPDGSSLVYTDSGSASDAAEMRTVPIAGGQSTILFGGGRRGMGHAASGSLSPDGSLVTMTGHEVNGPGAAVFVSNADGTQRRAIAGYGTNPAGTWSPDGSQIVCLSYGGGILVVDIATGDASRVAKGSAAIWLDDHTLLIDV